MIIYLHGGGLKHVVIVSALFSKIAWYFAFVATACSSSSGIIEDIQKCLLLPCILMRAELLGKVHISLFNFVLM